MKLYQLLTESGLSPDVEQMLLKLRKDSTGFLSPKKLQQVLEVLPGWKMEKADVFLPSKRFDQRELKEISDADVSSFGGYQNKPITVLGGHRAKDQDAELMKFYDDLLKNPNFVKTLPNKVKPDTLYYMDVSKPKKSSEYQGHLVITLKIFYGSKGFKITDPKGKVFELGKEQGYKHIVMYEFLRWANKETSFKQDILDVLKMPSVEDEKKNRKPPTRENTGTCPVCFNEQKLNGGFMVLHGYSRPGHGYVEGKCFGVGFEPFEKSSKGTVKWVEKLKNFLANSKKSLKELKSGKVKTLSYPVRFKAGRPELETIEPGHKNWSQALDNATRKVEGDIKQVNSDIDWYTKKIDNWKEEDLPWEKLQKAKNKK